LRPPHRLAHLDRWIAVLGASRSSIRGSFFLLSIDVFFFAPNITAGRSMTGGPHAQGPSGQWAGHFPLAHPLASPLASDGWGHGLLIYRPSDGPSQRISAVDCTYNDINRLPPANRPTRAPTQSPLPSLSLPLNPSRHRPTPPRRTSPPRRTQPPCRIAAAAAPSPPPSGTQGRPLAQSRGGRGKAGTGEGAGRQAAGRRRG
jgi:hypothetical protein